MLHTSIVADRSDDSMDIFTAVLLLVGGMGSIVGLGLVSLAFVSPAFVEATFRGLAGDGSTRLGVILFGVQLLVFVLVGGGLLRFAWRRRYPHAEPAEGERTGLVGSRARGRGARQRRRGGPR